MKNVKLADANSSADQEAVEELFIKKRTLIKTNKQTKKDYVKEQVLFMIRLTDS